MKLDTKQQVLLAFYLEYQKDLPDMKNITNTALNMDIDVFHVAVEKLDNEGYITGFKTYPADNNRFYNVRMDDIKLTRDGIEYVEQNFGIKKEITAEDKIKYIVRQCGIYGLKALKLFGEAALKALIE